MRQDSSFRNGDSKYPASGAPPNRQLDIFICNDWMTVQALGEQVGALLRESGCDVTIYCADVKESITERLHSLLQEGLKLPDIFLLDVMGVGTEAAIEVLNWYERHQPGQPLPVIAFSSTALGLSVREPAIFMKKDSRAHPLFVDTAELEAVSDFLSGNLASRFLTTNPPLSRTFRLFLNERLGAQFPLNVNDELLASYMTQIKRSSTDELLRSLRDGATLNETTLEWVRSYALGLSRSLIDGYMAGASEAETDALFYSGTGFPVRGKAVFSLDAVKNFKDRNDALPILVMQSYDPAVVPLLASGKLGGLVITSTYMASHLKLLCETYMVPGLFGLKPSGEEELKEVFDEESRSDLPSYFEGKTKLAGVVVEEGQDISIRYGKNGALFDPSKIRAAVVDNVKEKKNPGADTNSGLVNLMAIDRAMRAFLQDKGIDPGRIKATLNAANPDILEHVGDIGLVRTEQLASASEAQLQALKSFWLDGDAQSCATAAHLAKNDYETVLQKSADGHPVRIRLYDFLHREVLGSPEDRSRFLAMYGAPDIRGGEALARWPGLYEAQLAAIFEACKNKASKSSPPVEIMMPAIKGEADVLTAKRMIEQAAQRAGIDPGKYKFGVMVETLQACENIQAIVPHCDFISFGANDLTQAYFGVSRSDLKKHEKLAASVGCNPFEIMAPCIFDLIKSVAAQARQAKPQLEISVCGAQAANAVTAARLFSEAHVDSISVMPSLGNMYGLAVVVAYGAYDAFCGNIKAAAVAAPPFALSK